MLKIHDVIISIEDLSKVQQNMESMLKEIEKRKSDLLRQQGSVMNGLRDIQKSAAHLIVRSL